MAKSSNKKKKKTQDRPAREWPRWVRDFVLFVLGTLFGLYVVKWFVASLPGPTVGATLYGLRGTSGNVVGCTYYTLTVFTNEPIEYLYIKVQFPTQINDYKVGWGQESVSRRGARNLTFPHDVTKGNLSIVPGVYHKSGLDRMTLQAWEAGKNAAGRCSVIQSAVNNDDAGVQASAAGNMITVNTSKLPAKTTIMGMVATTDQESSVKLAPSMYTEGEYEYVKLGQTVRKPLQISDKGVTDAK